VPYPTGENPTGWIELTTYPLKNSDGVVEGIIEYIKDITKRKKAEEKILKSEEKYREAYNRAEFYKDIFAHDIKNILQSILSGMEVNELILNDPEQLENLKINARIIKEQVIRGAELVSNVRKLSQLEEIKQDLKKIEIFNALENVISLVKKSNKDRKIAFRIDSVDGNLFAKANDFLEDILENLLINAIKHNRNIIIDITVRISREQKKVINYVKMEFLDNGIGVDDTMKELIFKRGYNEDKSVLGMGLGLSIVRRIIETYNGKIWVEDRVKGDRSKGCNFVLLIPEVD
jgi:signal transduction histidine kinase